MKTNQFKNFAPKVAVALTAALALTAPLTVFARGGQAGITMATAKSIALKDAGISPSKAVFVEAKLGWENGIRVYDLEFISGAYEYDYDIAVSNGAIVDKDVDLLDD